MDQSWHISIMNWQKSHAPDSQILLDVLIYYRYGRGSMCMWVDLHYMCLIRESWMNLAWVLCIKLCFDLHNGIKNLHC